MGWVRTVTRYEPVKHTVVKQGKCEGCGKKTRRQTTLQNTISPFNKNPDGTPRTRAEIVEKLHAEGEEWVETFPLRCSGCERDRKAAGNA